MPEIEFRLHNGYIEYRYLERGSRAWRRFNRNCSPVMTPDRVAALLKAGRRRG